jgi:hypothetical protein
MTEPLQPPFHPVLDGTTYQEFLPTHTPNQLLAEGQPYASNQDSTHIPINQLQRRDD